MTLADIARELLAELLFLLTAPAAVPEMLWITIPLVVTLLAMTFYFGRYVREQLGWNTALGNSIVLVFVGIDLLRTVYHYAVPGSFLQFLEHPVKTAVILFIILEAVLLAYVSFKHALPKQVAFFMASPLPVNLQAYIVAALIYAQQRPSVYTLPAAILLFFALYGLLKLMQELQHALTGYHVRKEAAERQHRRQAREEAEERQKRKEYRERAKRAKARK